MSSTSGAVATPAAVQAYPTRLNYNGRDYYSSYNDNRYDNVDRSEV